MLDEPHAPSLDDGAARQAMEKIVLEGLSRPQKALPPFLFYDAHGSELFEAITDLPEYYPTRTEAAILKRAAPELAADAPAGAVLVEYGSGSSRKTEILLATAPSPAAYAPIDVSPSALAAATRRISRRFPHIALFPTVGDFSACVSLPDALAGHARIGFFPGSTIGNFDPGAALELLRGMAAALGPSARLIIGVDLLKDAAILLPAYDDSAGVTAAFNLNILARINRELDGDFDLDAFRHEARFDAEAGRIEMRLVSRRAQTARVGGHAFSFARDEAIHTENSYKYSKVGFQDLARRSGWTPRRIWTDEAEMFSVHELTVAAR